MKEISAGWIDVEEMEGKVLLHISTESIAFSVLMTPNEAQVLSGELMRANLMTKTVDALPV